LGREEEAFADLKLVLSEADAYNNLGFLLMRDGQLDKARSYFEKAIAHSPHYHDLANKNLQNLARLEESHASKP
jgi:Tfp pilus assembly protein PilF